MQAPIILFLSSTSMHFPLDLQALLVNEGQEAVRIDSIDSFFSAPERNRPYIAVLEVGSIDDLDRALLAYEWCDQIQPLAPCRVLLLIASKNIEIGDKSSRFGTAEVAHLPLPFKNLLFKIDLQKRLLSAEQSSNSARAKKSAAGFSSRFIERQPNSERVLLARGPGPKSGFWQEAGESPQGKIRWRWVATPVTDQEKAAVAVGISWVAESKTKPAFEPKEDAWAIVDPEAELIGFKKDKPVYSATVAEAAAIQAADKTAAGQGQSIAVQTPLQKPEGQNKKTSGQSMPSMAPEQLNKNSTANQLTDKINLGKKEATSTNEKKSSPSFSGQSEGSQSVPANNNKTAEQNSQTLEKNSKSGTTSAWSEEKTDWNIHAPEVEIARLKREKQAPEAEIKKALDSLREITLSAPSEPAREKAKVEESIPSVQHKGDEREKSGFSVPVPSTGKTEIAEEIMARADAMHSRRPEEFPQNEAEYQAKEKARPPLPRKEAEITGKIIVPPLQPPPAPAAPTELSKSERTGELKMRQDGPPAAGLASPPPVPETTAKSDPAPARTNSILAQAKPTIPASESRQAVHRELVEKQKSLSATKGNYEERPEEQANFRGDKEITNPTIRVQADRELPPEEVAIRIRAEIESDRKASGGPKTLELENYLKYRHFVTMTLEELNDRDSSWHPVDGYRIYISAFQRYYGVKDPNLLLPLWLYEGELAPEFLEKQRAWKFYDRYPELYSTLDTLPPRVVEQVHRLAGIRPMAEATNSRPSPKASAQFETIAPVAEPAKKETDTKAGLWGGFIKVVKKVTGLK